MRVHRQCQPAAGVLNMDLWRSLSGMVQVEVVSADLPGLLSALPNMGIEIEDAVSQDLLTATLSVRKKDLVKVRRLCEKRGEGLRVLHRRGLYWAVKGILSRLVLVLGFLILTALHLFLPTRVLFVQVEGNHTVPAQKILEQAGQCGIYFGASRSAVRSEKVKNALLEAMPELQWAGVTTTGCVAVVQVRERRNPTVTEKDIGASSIVATQDGVICQLTVTAGTPLCKIGDAVVKGQTLISGYTDLGLVIRCQQAEGEIYAYTGRKIQTLIPLEQTARGVLTGSETKFSLLLGKNRINFYKGSGISPTGCVKMYAQNYITLPGGYVLPVAILRETYYNYQTMPQSQTAQLLTDSARDFTQQYLRSQMVAGQVLNSTDEIREEPGLLLYTGSYKCLEMIGAQRKEEIIGPYGK